MAPEINVSAFCAEHGYTCVRAIGRGSFGVAQLVRDKDGQLCVMKTVDITRLDRNQTKTAAEEVTVLAGLKHPYIVRYRQSLFDKSILAIVMDYAEGGDLHKKICTAKASGRRFLEVQVLRWITQMVLGLKYLHGKSILHRDLKPQNLFLTKQDQLRIGDFGISKVLNSNKLRETTQMGTPFYMSPEVLTEGLYSFQSDVWSVGCILFELCALHVPFEAGSLPALANRIKCEPAPAIPATYSAELQRLGLQLLARERAKRPVTGDIIQGRLIQGEISRMLQDESQARGSNPSLEESPGSRIPSKGSDGNVATPLKASPAPTRQASPSPARFLSNSPGDVRRVPPLAAEAFAALPRPGSGADARPGSGRQNGAGSAAALRTSGSAALLAGPRGGIESPRLGAPPLAQPPAGNGELVANSGHGLGGTRRTVSSGGLRRGVSTPSRGPPSPNRNRAMRSLRHGSIPPCGLGRPPSSGGLGFAAPGLGGMGLARPPTGLMGVR